jgi:hypothetical protein
VYGHALYEHLVSCDVEGSMASKQTRRSISVRGTTYAMLRDFCAEHDRSMSDVVEELLSRILESDAPAKKTVAPLVARAPQAPQKLERHEPKAEPKVEPKVEPEAKKPVEDRAAVRVEPRPAPAAPAKAAAKAARPGPARPVPVANAGRPAPTPASKVEGTTRAKHSNGDYRAIRF